MTEMEDLHENQHIVLMRLAGMCPNGNVPVDRYGFQLMCSFWSFSSARRGLILESVKARETTKIIARIGEKE